MIAAVERRIEPTHQKWIAELRALADAAANETELAYELLDWSATATADYAEDFGDALALAGLIGRNEIHEEADEGGFSAPSVGTVEFKEAHDFLKQKIKMPSKTWAENLHQAHDRAFVVAGADSATLVEDLFGALMKGKEGGGIEAFRKGFDEIVARTGWQYNGGRNWRTRVIYETNIRTAHMAGRLAQMRDPDVIKARPYWQYVHGEIREPKQPRHEHQAWDGKVFAHDDPIWQVIFPPNGWKCSCGVRTLSAAGLRRLGKVGPDTPPKLEMRKVKDPATGNWVDVPKGIDFGWAYQPGDTWQRGLVPHDLQKPLGPPKASVLAPLSVSKPPLSDFARPFVGKKLDSDREPDFYVGEFLRAFGADIGKAALFRDRAGTALAISDDLFLAYDKISKAKKFSRHLDAAFMAEAIIDPDEIWLDWQLMESGQWRMVRRYLRWDANAPPNAAVYSAFEMSKIGWSGITVFTPKQRSNVSNPKPDLKYIEKYRKGALVYRRK